VKKYFFIENLKCGLEEIALFARRMFYWKEKGGDFHVVVVLAGRKKAHG